jgi:hypothetical protein
MHRCVEIHYITRMIRVQRQKSVINQPNTTQTHKTTTWTDEISDHMKCLSRITSISIRQQTMEGQVHIAAHFISYPLWSRLLSSFVLILDYLDDPIHMHHDNGSTRTEAAVAVAHGIKTQAYT